MELAPQESTPYIALANLLFFRRKDDKAFDVLERTVKTAGKPAAAVEFVYSQGLQFIRDKNVRRAIPCFVFAADHSAEQRAQLHYFLGELYEELDQKPDAIRYFLQASTESPALPQAFVKLALLHHESDPAKSVAILAEGERRLPENLLILLAAAQILSADSRFQEAIAVFERVRGIVAKQGDPKKVTPSFFIQYGVVSDKAGQRERAEKVFEDCVQVYPDAHEALNYLAYMWAEQNRNLDQALRYVNRALALDPGNGAYVDTRGWIYYRQGRYEEALHELRTAGDLTEDDPTILDHVGDTLNALGRREDARLYWKRSLQIAAEQSAVAEKLRAAGLDPTPILKEAADAKRKKEADLRGGKEPAAKLQPQP
jgi:tetratricopeptide (TPR) repeat protein